MASYRKLLAALKRAEKANATKGETVAIVRALYRAADGAA